ncbi:hypothetical protein KC207_11120 [Phycicoccus sp. BSK3Z-2]|uniref:Uncharacterized protein n=1 Tax=Phycicoccus avicenniae TaxID=2828860 RepID=A0A941I122_9MICO|nr:hypothetical protein [Phycicoccus avicenniae]MBR7743841.1 hypothetical protein [Phycicoccus avicenniae]
MDLESVARELYALAPEEFTAARNALARELRAAGDRELAGAVAALRRASPGAHLLNRLVAARPDEVEQVLDLGVRLRAAQGTLAPAELRALDDERRRLTRALAGVAVEAARDEGRRVSPSVAAAVEETLRSAMVDPVAGEALGTGLLVETFSASGLDPVDLTRVLAVPGLVGSDDRPRTTPGPQRAAPDPERVAQARSAVDEAEAGVRTSRERVEAARRRAGEAGRRREDLRTELEDLERRVADVRGRLDAAGAAADDARRAQHVATRDERTALEALERARRRLADLGGSPAERARVEHPRGQDPGDPPHGSAASIRCSVPSLSTR